MIQGLQYLSLEVPKMQKQPHSEFIKPNSSAKCINHRILESMHIVGEITLFKYSHDKYFIGTKEGMLYIKDNKKDRQIQLVAQVKDKSIFTSIVNSITPFRSQINQNKKTTLMNDLVDISYSRYKQPEPEQQTTAILSLDLTIDEQLLLIGTAGGELHIYNYHTLHRLELLQFETPINFLIIYMQQSQSSFVDKLQTTLHQYYEILCCDEYGQINKIYLDLFKLLDKKSLKYTHIQLQNELEQTHSTKGWWHQQYQQLHIQQQYVKILYDIKQITTNDNNKSYSLFAILWTTALQVVKVMAGKNRDQQQYFIINSLPRINADLFYQQFNALSTEDQINPDSQGSCIALGSGTYLEHKQHRNSVTQVTNQLLLYNYGPMIFIYTYDLIPCKFGILTYPLKYLEDNTVPTIRHITFLADNIILVYYSNGDAFILHLDDFGINVDFAQQFFQYSSRIKSKSIADLLTYTCEGKLCTEFRDQNIKDQQIYSKTLQIKFNDCQYYNNTLIYLDKRLRVCSSILMTLDEYLTQFIGKQQFLEGLSEIYRLIKKQNKLIACLPQKELVNQLNPYIRDFTLQYVKNTIVIDVDYLIDYLVFTNNEEFLFTEIHECLKAMGKSEQLNQVIGQKSIQYIPGELLYTISKELKQEQLINLLFNLNPNKVDMHMFVHICREHQLIELMILFCNANQDYITPIATLFDDKRLVQYILMIVDGYNIQGDQMLKMDHWTAMKNIFSYILINDHIQQILLHDQQLQIGLHILETNILIQIDSLSQGLVELTPEQGQFASVLLQSTDTLIAKIITVFAYNYQQSSVFNIKYLYNFISKAAFTKSIKLVKQQHLSIIIHYLNNFDDLQEMEDRNSFYENHLNIYFLSGQISVMEVEQLLNKCNNFIKQHTSVVPYLESLLGRQMLAFKQWMVINDITVKVKVFKWLNDVFRKHLQIYLTDQEIIDGFRLLLAIDPIQTSKFIYKHLISKQLLIMDSIEEETAGFYEYTKFVFDQKYQISEQFKVKYLKYLCQYNPKIVKQQLKLFEFPQKESLELCIKYNNYKACRWIYDQAGEYKQLVVLLSERLVQKVKNCIKILLKTKALDEKSRQSVLRTLKRIKQACYKEQQISDDIGSVHSLWLIALVRFFHENPLRNFTLRSLPQLIKDQLMSVAIYLLQGMLYTMNFYDFVQVIKIKYPEMQATMFSKLFKSVINQQFNLQQSYYFGQLLYKDQIVTHTVELYKYSMQGYCVRRLQCQCIVPEYRQHPYVIVYRCNHAYHTDCVQQQYCTICNVNIRNRSKHQQYNQL